MYIRNRAAINRQIDESKAVKALNGTLVLHPVPEVQLTQSDYEKQLIEPVVDG
jgi:hypothetical protein